jgi:hypothetical protein
LEAPVEDAGVVDERCLVPYTLAPVDPAPAAPLPTRAEALALLRGAGVADLPADGEIDVAFHQRVTDDDRGWKMEVGGYYVGEDRSVVVARGDPERGHEPLEVSDLRARTEQERAELALARRVATCAGERPGSSWGTRRARSHGANAAAAARTRAGQGGSLPGGSGRAWLLTGREGRRAGEARGGPAWMSSMVGGVRGAR